MAVKKEPIAYICDRCDGEAIGFNGNLPPGWSLVILTIKDGTTTKEKTVHTCNAACTSHAQRHPRDFFMTA